MCKSLIFSLVSIYSILTTCSASAQRYDLQVLGFGSQHTLTARELTASGLILGEEINEAQGHSCPFLAELSGSSLRRLCAEGLLGALDINDSGAVVGYHGSRDPFRARAALWSKRRGLRDLGVLEPHHTFSYALAINNSGLIIGISGWLEEKFYDDDPADSSPPTSYAVEHFRGFTWDRTHGMRALSRRDKVYAFAINDRGEMLVQDNSKSRIFLRRQNGTMRAIRPDGLYFGSPIEARDFSAFDRHGHAIIGRYRRLPRRFETEPFLNELYADRSDNKLAEAAINKWGIVSGTFNGVPLVARSILKGDYVYANCITNAAVKVAGVAGVTAKGAILGYGDVLGDNLPARLLLFTPRPKARYGPFADFCPVLSASVQGPCAAAGSENFDIIAEPKVGGTCRIKACVGSTNAACLPGVRLALALTEADYASRPYCEPLYVYATTPPEARNDGSCCVNIPFNWAAAVNYTLKINDDRYGFRRKAPYYDDLEYLFWSTEDDPKDAPEAGCASHAALP